jgi:hypothetical protein
MVAAQKRKWKRKHRLAAVTRRYRAATIGSGPRTKHPNLLYRAPGLAPGRRQFSEGFSTWSITR